MNLFSARHIVKVDGKTGLFRGLSPRITSSVISTVVRGKVRQVKLYKCHQLHKLFGIMKAKNNVFLNILYVGDIHKFHWLKTEL